jgi:nucleoside-diphosphate-sugar epimerase
VNYILGASGLIGSAITSNLSGPACRIVPRSEYKKWGNLDEIQLFMESNLVSARDTFFVCSGITDPKGNSNQLTFLNVEVPLNLISKSKMFEANVVTFGSIQENSRIVNPYVQSKKEFFRKACLDNSYSGHSHFQLHTVYGLLKPKRHMLLGLFLEAIQKGATLEMTSGQQYREYWHSLDIANFVLSGKWKTQDELVIPVSSGQPVQIAELASKVFEHFSVIEHLKLGTIPDDPSETYNRNMFIESHNSQEFMREPIQGVIDYLSKFIQESNNVK